MSEYFFAALLLSRPGRQEAFSPSCKSGKVGGGALSFLVKLRPLHFFRNAKEM